MTGATCDTSVLVPALVSWHPEHENARRALRSARAIPAHVTLETFSVLTRLPAPHRIAAQDAGELIARLGLAVEVLPAERHVSLLVHLASHGIRGGAVYDALVAATASHHGRVLLTRDRRARPTYDAVEADYTLV